MVWVIRVMRPRIHFWCFRMTVQFKHLYLAFPHRFAPKNLFDGNAFNVAGFDAMQAPNYVPQLVNVRTHWLAIGIGRPPLPKNKSSSAILRTCHCSSSSSSTFNIHRPSLLSVTVAIRIILFPAQTTISSPSKEKSTDRGRTLLLSRVTENRPALAEMLNLCRSSAMRCALTVSTSFLAPSSSCLKTWASEQSALALIQLKFVILSASPFMPPPPVVHQRSRNPARFPLPSQESQRSIWCRFTKL